MRIVQVGSYPLDITHINGGVEASVYGISMEQAKSHRVFVFDVPRSTFLTSYLLPLLQIKYFLRKLSLPYRLNKHGYQRRSIRFPILRLEALL